MPRCRACAALCLGLLLFLGAPAIAAGADKGLTASPVRDGRSTFSELRELNADFVVVSATWASLAPERPSSPVDHRDPAYDWSALDQAVRDGKRFGVGVVPLVGRTPAWANGGQPSNVPPTDLRDYARFLTAMSTRYPGIERWMIWGEPSRSAQWSPQGVAGARRYAQLLDLAHGAIKGVDSSDRVIGGNSYCCGRDDADSTSTRTWIKRLRLPDGRPPRLDLWGMNPFGSRPIDISADPVNRKFMDYNDLDTLASLLDEAYPGQKVPIFIQEIGFPTEHANRDFPFITTRGEQARRLEQLFEMVDRLPRVAAISNYLLYDHPKGTDAEGFTTGFTTGLRTADGVKKPAWDVFRRLAAKPRPRAAGITLSAAQLRINQRISQAAVRRANAVQAWLDDGVTSRDLVPGGLTAADFAAGMALSAGAPAEARPAAGAPASPRPVVVAPAAGGSGAGRVTLSAAQLRTNQRISQTAVRRANALERRLEGGLTGGDLVDGAVTARALAPGLSLAAVAATRPAPSRTEPAPARPSGGGVGLSAAQLRINQRISQAAVRRTNALIARIADGVDGGEIRDGSLVPQNLAPGLARPR